MIPLQILTLETNKHVFNVKNKIPLLKGLYCARNQKEKEEEEAKWEEGAFSCIRDDLNHAN